VRAVTPIWILHVDLDQFLASVETHRHPELRVYRHMTWEEIAEAAADAARTRAGALTASSWIACG
jgi:nucleotidyltransferase/DNA polymerase involved in DNA repair